MDILKLIINEERYNYKCFDELKRLYYSDIEFRNIIDNGFKEGKLSGFDDDIWKKIANQNIRRINSFEDVFRDGANIGYCTVASKQLSYSLDNPYICGGILPILKGTRNCLDGSHTWINDNGYIIDTSLMLIIEENYSKNFGYKEINRYNPNSDPIYVAAKEFTRDSSLKK